MDPWVVLQYLTAGTALVLTDSGISMQLPVGVVSALA